MSDLLKVKPYPAYKPSGIDWLGDIPVHWEVRRLKNWLSINQSVLPETTDPGYEFRYLEIGGVGTGVLTDEPARIRFANAPSRARRIVRAGDTIISTVRTYLKAIWFADEIDDDLVCSTGFTVLTPRKGTVPKFVSYLTQNDFFTDKVTSESVGIAYPAVAESRLSSFRMPIPPLAEQAAIVRYLDRADERIRRAIAAKQRLIDLLTEQRQAVIHRAVTRGIDDRAPMKPSGVEWLGDIPAHWEVRRLKDVGRLKSGAGFPHRYQGEMFHDIPFFKVADLGVKTNTQLMKKWRHTVSTETAETLGAYVFPASTIVFAKVGAALMLNRRRLLIRTSCIDNNMMGFVPRAVLPHWILYWMTTIDLGMFVNPGAVPSVNEGQVGQTATIIPPLAEQAAIVRHLDKATADIDAAMENARRQVELLREYRARLIADVVTGRVDARRAN